MRHKPCYCSCSRDMSSAIKMFLDAVDQGVVVITTANSDERLYPKQLKDALNHHKCVSEPILAVL